MSLPSAILLFGVGEAFAMGEPGRGGGAAIIGSLLPVILLLVIFYLYYKYVIRGLHTIYKIVLNIVGTILGLVGFVGTVGLLGTMGVEPPGSLILGILVGFLFATPNYFLARIIGRIEDLEKRTGGRS